MAQERIEGNVPLTIDFTNSSVGDNLSYNWDFGDGSTSTDSSPQHTYNSIGTFIVSLTVTNTYGSNSKTSEVLVTEARGDTQDRDTGTREEETRERSEAETRETQTRETQTRETGTGTQTRETQTRETDREREQSGRQEREQRDSGGRR